MKNSKILKIVKYNIDKNLRNKWFVGLNILLFVISLVALNFSLVKDLLKQNNIILNDEKLNIEVVDSTNNFYTKFEETIQNSNIYQDVTVTKVENVNYDENISKDKVIIEVQEDIEKILKVKVISKDGIDQKYYDVIQSALDYTKKDILKEKYNLTDEDILVIESQVEVERIMVGVDNENSDIKQIAQTIVNYLTLIILMLILSKIATDISQEKVTKSIEYVLTSISAKQYLIAKVISINITMIIQFIFTFVYFVISSSINSILNLYIKDGAIDLSSGFSISSISSLLDTTMISYIAIVLVFLVLTVILMCIIQAAFSSKTTNISEAGNTTTILLTMNFVLYFVATLIITPLKETNIVIYILSCLPIISMYFVPSMIIIGQANIIQIIIATITLVISIPVSLNICSKIFKNGILDNYIKNKKEKDVKEISNESIKDKEIKKLEKKELSRYGYIIGMSVIIYIAVQFISTYVLALLINPIYNVFGGAISLENVEMIINILVFILSLSIPALFVMFHIDNTNETRKKVNTKDTINLVLIALPLVFIVQIVLGILLEKLGLNYDIVDKLNIYNDSSVLSKILFFIYIAILPAIFEELYIRKAALNFSRKYGNIFAIISTAILFSVLHMNISQSLFAFIMGVILGVIAIHSNSIIPCAIVHFLNNGYAALTIIFENNSIALLVINIIFGMLILVGVILGIKYIIKERENIKESIKNIKKTNIKREYKYIAFDYTFILACILMIVMIILTQKTISIL